MRSVVDITHMWSCLLAVVGCVSMGGPFCGYLLREVGGEDGSVYYLGCGVGSLIVFMSG